MRWVVGGSSFVKAYAAVRRNGGAAGVDGLSVQELPRYLTFHWERIKQELLEGNYRPSLVRGIRIPKPNGGERQLGIPTVMDRVIQQSIHQVLSPIFEPIFSAFSYGFRPRRTAHQALFQAVEYINSGRQWIIDLDLKSFFDQVNHDKLMYLISQKVGDKNPTATNRKIPTQRNDARWGSTSSHIRHTTRRSIESIAFQYLTQ